MGASDSYHILAVNAGSSSIKVTVFKVSDQSQRVAEILISNIGQPNASLIVKAGRQSDSQPVTETTYKAAVNLLTSWLKQQDFITSISVIGHRIVHGGPHYSAPQVIDAKLLDGLNQLTAFDPDHLPGQIQLIEELQALLSHATQVACFDTAFHHDLPKVSQTIAIPRRYQAKGIRRYGFHGLSYEYLLQELRYLEGSERADGRLILAHLGSGVSLTAVRNGKSIDTTMGLTPASGVPMSTRSGDIDPGLALFLASNEKLSAHDFNNLINKESGLLGVSGQTGDMKKLLELETHNQAAKEAVDLFCYQVKKAIGGLAAALGGLDVLVFSGGMGEDAPKIRAKICHDLDFLGIKLNTSRNQAQADIISDDDSPVLVRIIHTDEAAIIAQHAWELQNKGAQT